MLKNSKIWIFIFILPTGLFGYIHYIFNKLSVDLARAQAKKKAQSSSIKSVATRESIPIRFLFISTFKPVSDAIARILLYFSSVFILFTVSFLSYFQSPRVFSSKEINCTATEISYFNVSCVSCWKLREPVLVCYKSFVSWCCILESLEARCV